jgi:hypothetical protein
MPSLHGFELDCDRPARRFSQAPGPLGAIRVAASASSPLAADGELVHLIEGEEGDPVYALARSDARLVAWHADAGSYSIDPDAMTIGYRVEDAARPSDELRWGDRLGSTAVPLLAGRLGGLPLHASANLVAGRALVICGISGRGKSTLAAALAARGHPLLAEDGVVVRRVRGRPLIWPGMGGALVTEEAATAIGADDGGGSRRDRRGRALLPLTAAVEPAEVGAVAVLAERAGANPAAERLDAARAHRELFSQVLAGGRASPEAFSSAARLAERTPVFLVRIPDRIASLGEACAVLAELVRSDRVRPQAELRRSV